VPPAPVRAAIPRVGVLTDQVMLSAIFVQGLRDADWEVSEEVIVERRGSAPGADRWRGAVRELVARRVSALVAGDHAAARAAREATDAIPIVAIDFEGDPVGSGFVRSLTRPGGNVTGFFCDFGDAMSELAKAFHAAAPKVRQVVALTDGEATEMQARALRAAARSLDLAVDTIELGAAGAEAFVDRVAAARAALFVLASPRLESEAARLAKRAILRKMASAGAFIRYAHAGGLLARGPSLPDAFRRAAAMVDRVLRGARIADIAVERPPRFELVINLKTAAALELALPPGLLSSSDHVLH
jgi:putative ABC transport system substrate-binding protein